MDGLKEIIRSWRTLVEYASWYGVAAILSAYGLVSFGLISPKSGCYQVLNFTGAVSIVAVSLIKRAYQPAVLNAIWAIIALFALLELLLP